MLPELRRLPSAYLLTILLTVLFYDLEPYANPATIVFVFHINLNHLLINQSWRLYLFRRHEIARFVQVQHGHQKICSSSCCLEFLLVLCMFIFKT